MIVKKMKRIENGIHWLSNSLFDPMSVRKKYEI